MDNPYLWLFGGALLVWFARHDFWWSWFGIMFGVFITGVGGLNGMQDWPTIILVIAVWWAAFFSKKESGFGRWEQKLRYSDDDDDDDDYGHRDPIDTSGLDEYGRNHSNPDIRRAFRD